MRKQKAHRGRYAPSGKYDNGNFSQMPRRVYDTKEMLRLQRDHPRAFVLLSQLSLKHNGTNNGDLDIATLREEWTTKSTLYKSAAILVKLGWIVKTRQGTFGSHPTPDLYALTWLPIDECDGKTNLFRPTTAPLDKWRDPDMYTSSYTTPKRWPGEIAQFAKVPRPRDAAGILVSRDEADPFVGRACPHTGVWLEHHWLGLRERNTNILMARTLKKTRQVYKGVPRQGLANNLNGVTPRTGGFLWSVRGSRCFGGFSSRASRGKCY